MSEEENEVLAREEEPLSSTDEPEPETIEAPKPKATRYKKASEGDGRKKGQRTPAQIAAFERCRAKRDENCRLRKEEDETAAAARQGRLVERARARLRADGGQPKRSQILR